MNSVKNNGEGVTFRRINGRVVPIRSRGDHMEQAAKDIKHLTDSEQLSSAVKTGAVAGSTVAAGVAGVGLKVKDIGIRADKISKKAADSAKKAKFDIHPVTNTTDMFQRLKMSKLKTSADHNTARAAKFGQLAKTYKSLGKGILKASPVAGLGVGTAAATAHLVSNFYENRKKKE